ncbi:MAG: hypothetical protein H8D63_02825 [Parcubacteria group bacterium]|nr:hypothetical protein [Parcubacteria group bacterium]
MENDALKEPFQWTAPEYQQKAHTPDWYWGVGLAGIVLIAIGITTNNPLFSIFILIAVASVFFFNARTPHIVDFGISRKGVRVDKTLYPFITLESFWIRENILEEREPKLILKSKKMVMPLVIIPLPEGVDFDELQDFLEQFIQEEEHPEQLSEQIMDRLGF